MRGDVEGNHFCIQKECLKATVRGANAAVCRPSEDKHTGKVARFISAGEQTVRECSDPIAPLDSLEACAGRGQSGTRTEKKTLHSGFRNVTIRLVALLSLVPALHLRMWPKAASGFPCHSMRLRLTLPDIGNP
jgi:hypothetical protein